MILLNMITNKDIIAIIGWSIPYIIILIGIVFYIRDYIKKHGMNHNSIMAIIKNLANNEQFKKVVEEAIKLVAETADISESEGMNTAVTSLKKYLSTYIYSNIQLLDSIIETDPEDDVIAAVLKDNNINIDNIENVIDSLLMSMGYNDNTIRYLIVEAVNEKYKK